jgi:hypothetical protein
MRTKRRTEHWLPLDRKPAAAMLLPKKKIFGNSANFTGKGA